MNPKYHIANFGLGSKNSTLSFVGMAEYQNGHFTPIAWVGIKENSGSKRESMLFSAIDLRSLSLACKELLRKGTTEYRKHTDSRLAGGNGNKKMMTLAGENGHYFINIMSGGIHLGFPIEKYELYGLSDSIALFADELERTTYSYQRKAHALKEKD